jgi:hypothetical protein
MAIDQPFSRHRLGTGYPSIRIVDGAVDARA